MIGEDIRDITIATDGVQEIQPNQGFNDPDFEARIKATGWEQGQPWCAASAIADWKDAYRQYPNLYAKASRLYSLNSQQMAINFHADPVWPTSTTTPEVGAMVIFGEGESTVSGHTGIVIEVLPDNQYRTEEGNTIPPGNPGNQREGYCKAQHVHTIGLPHSDSGLNFIRFILPIEP